MMMMNLKVVQRAVASIALLAASKSIVAAFTTPSEIRYHPPLRVSTNQLLGVNDPSSSTSFAVVDAASTVVDITSSSSAASTRRAFLATSAVILTSGNALLFPANAADGQDYVEPTTTTPSASDDAFESIASRAARVAREVTESEVAQQIADEEVSQRRQDLVQKLKDDTRTIYDFTLPVNGKAREISELIGQTFSGGDGGDGWTDGAEKESSAPGRMNGGRVVGTRVKAILVVNMKQDDPIARKNIPELIELLTRFGRNGEFAVIMSPTDQGYYEPDTSALLRLKLEQEYGYGNAYGTILSDKVNLLGTGAVPLWRWIEGSCRTPAGLGKVQANFEKFLVDGRTGKPLRRYPRKYQPYDIADDISALIQGKPLPPAGSNFKEEWRNAAKEAENDTYRFQKGLNYFDQ